MRDPDRQGYRYGSNPHHRLERKQARSHSLRIAVLVLFIATLYALWP